MNLEAIKKKIEAGEQLTPEEINFLIERSQSAGGDPEQNLAEMVERAVDRILEPLLKAQRPFTPAPADDGSEQKSGYTPRHNKFTDLTQHLYRRDFAGIKEKALSEGTDSEGGYLVPVETMTEIVKYIGEYGVGRRDALVVPIGVSSIELNTQDSGLTAYYTSEASQITASAQVYSQTAIAAKKLAVLAGPISNELMADANVDLQAEIAEDTGDAFAYGEDNQIFNGNGTTFTGVLQHSLVNEVTLASGDITQIDYDSLNAMVYKIPSQRLTGAKWYAHRTVLEQIMAVTDGNGRPLFRESQVPGQPATLLGFPVVAAEAMPTATVLGSGDSGLVLGNLRNVRMYDLQQMAMKLLTEGTVATVNLGEKDSAAIRFTERHIIVVRRPLSLVRLKLA